SLGGRIGGCGPAGYLAVAASNWDHRAGRPPKKHTSSSVCSASNSVASAGSYGSGCIAMAPHNRLYAVSMSPEPLSRYAAPATAMASDPAPGAVRRASSSRRGTSRRSPVMFAPTYAASARRRARSEPEGLRACLRTHMAAAAVGVGVRCRCRWLCRMSRLLLVGGVGLDEGGDPVVQLVDPVEAAVAAGDDGDLRVRHEASPGAGLRWGEHGAARAGDQQDRHGDRAEFVVGEDAGELRLRPIAAGACPHERHQFWLQHGRAVQPPGEVAA